MTILRYRGIVEDLQDDSRTGYAWSDADDDRNGTIWIDGHDVVAEAAVAKWNGPVSVVVAEIAWTGDFVAATGWGYSEYTPMESDELMVGPHNLLSELRNLEGQAVSLVIADEPFSLIEAPPVDGEVEPK